MGLVYKGACELIKHHSHVVVTEVYLSTCEAVLQLVVILAVLLQDRTQFLDQRPDVLHIAVVTSRRHATSESVWRSRVGHGRVLSGHITRVIDVAKRVRKVFGDGGVVQRDELFMVVRVARFKEVRWREGRNGGQWMRVLSWEVGVLNVARSWRGASLSVCGAHRYIRAS
jgi:hypothetical protein